MKKFRLNLSLAIFFLGLPISGYAAVDQWASTVIGFSTQYSSDSWSASQALGAPNSLTYGDHSTAWTPKTTNAGSEFLTLGFKTPIIATGVTIRETYGSGFVRAIDAIDTNNIVHRVWTGKDTSLPDVINNFRISWPATRYLVKAVKVTIFTNTSQTVYKEIDAVKLHGLESLSGTISPRLKHKAELVCTNTKTGQSTKVTIKGSSLTAPVSYWNCENAGLKFKAGDKVKIEITGVIAP
ncbi:hypothetical protein [Crenothrix sp.]|uniref:hypothetical protein n=1 Tax=Crenothrix sp. TaxID=3100433 RepID=UPI00374D78B5